MSYVPLNHEKVAIGGLLRCCTKSIYDNRKDSTEPPANKAEMRCNYCSSSVVWDEDLRAWKWSGKA